MESAVFNFGAVLTAAVETSTTEQGLKYARVIDPVLSFDETTTNAEELRKLTRAYGFETR